MKPASGTAILPAMELPARLLVAMAGLLGAAGVVTAAVAAHGGGNETLRTAALFLLLHAAAITAASAVGMRIQASWPIPFVAGGLLAVGTLLFCGDLIAREWLGSRLFPMAAPAGGSILIVGWLTLAIGAIAGR
ncbi:MAG: DUF423 domain-containing protein [Alphaproteobacteria bacterium]